MTVWDSSFGFPVRRTLCYAIHQDSCFIVGGSLTILSQMLALLPKENAAHQGMLHWSVWIGQRIAATELEHPSDGRKEGLYPLVSVPCWYSIFEQQEVWENFLDAVNPQRSNLKVILVPFFLSKTSHYTFQFWTERDFCII